MIVSVAPNSDPQSHSTPIASKILCFVASRQNSYFRRDHWNWLGITTGSEPPKICGRVGFPFRIPAPRHTQTNCIQGSFCQGFGCCLDCLLALKCPVVAKRMYRRCLPEEIERRQLWRPFACISHVRACLFLRFLEIKRLRRSLISEKRTLLIAYC